MSIEMLKKVRIILTVIMGMMYLTGMQLGPDTEGHFYTFFEALIATLIILALNFAAWSDWLHNALADDGVKIDYKLYQVFGIFLVFIFMGLIVIVVASQK